MWGSWNLSAFPLKGCIIDPDLNGLPDSPAYTVHLPIHCGEIVHNDVMIWGVTMATDGGRRPEMLFEPFPKGP